ncbi:TonB-dependent siderophore receptor [Nitrobacter sp. NHB1]|uniref:TonB-dependent receptor n=1 Tax=Nitrobacter sp. NHB1 TaxID=3119830 RepID=UPI002FFF39E8
MGILSVDHTSDTSSGVGAAGHSSVVGWGKAMIGVAAVMLIPDSADAQPVTGADDLPQVRVTAPKRQAKKRTVHRAPVRAAPAPVAAPPSNVQVNPIVGDGHGVTGYQAPAQAGIARLGVPLRDTPQTVNVVTQQVIRDQHLTSMEEALRTVPGITFSAGEGGQQGDSPFIRGFTARGDMYRDGLRDPGWYNRDLFSDDRVEVLKGPSSFAFGRGSTGGAINTVSKLPTGATFFDGAISGTSAAGYRSTLDASGKQGNVAGRIAALYQDVPTPDRNNVFTRRWGVAPSVSFDVTDRDKVTLSHIYQGEQSVPDYGHPWLPRPTLNGAGTAVTGGYYGDGRAVTPIPVPRNTFYGNTLGPYRDIVETTTNITTLKLSHEFDNGFKLTNATRYVDNQRYAAPTPPRGLATAGNMPIPVGYPVDQMTLTQEHWNTQTNDALLLNQTDLVGKFDTWGLTHTFATGIEASHQTRYQRGRTNFWCASTPGAYCRTSVIDPVSQPVYQGPFGPVNHTKIDTIAVYASDQIKINQYFELLGAVRYDDVRASYRDPLNATPANRGPFASHDRQTSWRVGGVFHPTQQSSVYVAHGTSFNPSAEFGSLTSGTVSLAPETSTTTEVGTKIDFLNGRLSYTAALFHILKDNARIANAGPDSATMPTILAGEQRVQGFETGLAGKLTDLWQIFAGYTYQDSKIVSVPATASLEDRYTVGKQLPNTPQHAFSLWTTYDFTPQLTVGAGATYQSMAYARTDNTIYVPEYWKFDVMASYKVTKESTLQLNIYNLTDEHYYAQYYGGHAVPASGRSAILTYRYHFEPPPPVPDYPVKAARYVSK